MSSNEKEVLLNEYVNKHLDDSCNCNKENLELCLGGVYYNGLISKQEIFDEWE